MEPSPDLTDAAKHYVVDIRDAPAYSAGHIPNSVAIGLRGRLETWVGIMVPWDAKLVLAGDEKDLREALFRLHRVGYRPQLLDINKWKAASLPLSTSELIPPQKLHAQMQTAESPQVLDVRLPSEWMGLRIGTVINIPLNELSQRAGKLDRTMPVVAVCNSAYRSTMAVGILERAGIKKIASLAGGSEAWIEAGLPVFQAKQEGTAGGAPQRQIKLAERMSAAELKRLLQDLPGTFQLVDIRPKEQFADYQPAGRGERRSRGIAQQPVVPDRGRPADRGRPGRLAGDDGRRDPLAEDRAAHQGAGTAGCRPTGRKPPSAGQTPAAAPAAARRDVRGPARRPPRLRSADKRGRSGCGRRPNRRRRSARDAEAIE